MLLDNQDARFHEIKQYRSIGPLNISVSGLAKNISHSLLSFCGRSIGKVERVLLSLLSRIYTCISVT